MKRLKVNYQEITNYTILSAFTNKYYEGLITYEDLIKETVISVDGPDGKKIKKFVFLVEKNNRVFAIPSEIIDAKKLPIKITKSIKVSHRSNVFHLVKSYGSFRIKPVKYFNFKECIDNIAQHEHTAPMDYTIYKITVFMCYLKQMYSRCVSDAGFGKNSIVNILKSLMGNVARINPRTSAAYEHQLLKQMIALDELTALRPEQRDLLQQALLQTCDFSPTYTKGSRGSRALGTRDEYNISNMGVLALYNKLSYYSESGQEEKYFDKMFQKAVKDRFFPMKMKGVLPTGQFQAIEKPIQTANDNWEHIVNLVRTIKYFDQEFESEIKPYKTYKTYSWSKSGRQEKSFQIICQGISAYAKDEIEYNKYVERLYQMRCDYEEMAKVENTYEILEEELNASKTADKYQEKLM